MTKHLPLACGGLDRAAHRRRDPIWLEQAWQRGLVLPVAGSETLVRDEPVSDQSWQDPLAKPGPRLATLVAAEVPQGAERYFLGVDREGTPYFAVPLPLAEALAIPTLAGARIVNLRDVGQALPPVEAAVATAAVALDSWHRRARYSPQSGRSTTPGEAGWTRVTDDGAEIMWPATAPAVIALVSDGVNGPAGKCLLGHNAGWHSMGGLPRYSCLAGFVEPGESAEQAVVREVAEEVGVAVRDVRYVASQPWPFPGSLMLAFTAVADPRNELVCDPTEIAAASWFSREEVAAALSGQASEFCVPLGVSVAHYLLSGWVTGFYGEQS